MSSRRWRALWALGWLLGVALHLQQRELWSHAAYVALAGAVVGAWMGGWVWVWVIRSMARRVGRRQAWRSRNAPNSRRRWPRFVGPAAPAGLVFVTLAAFVTFTALGFAVSGWRAGALLSERLPAELEGRDVVVSGVVSSLPRVSAAGVQFRFQVEGASWRDAPVVLPRELWLGWWRGDTPDAGIPGLAGELRAGQRWRLVVRLKRPHGSFNPHGFDRELWLFEQGLRATGSVRAAALPAPLRLAAASRFWVDRWRQRVRDAIGAQVSDRRVAGLLAALAVGDQGAIDSDDWDLFRRTGTAHLVSVSGYISISRKADCFVPRNNEA